MVLIKLRRLPGHYWVLVAPSGAILSERIMYASEVKALRWAQAFCSTWYNYHVEFEDPNEQKSVMSQLAIQ
jgi:hypothetical protein